MVVVVSEDDGFSWTLPRWTKIWGFPAELIELQDGRYLMVYGYTRPPYGVRGCVSKDGVIWDVKNEFVIREGGVPGGLGQGGDVGRARNIDWEKPGPYQRIGCPSVVQENDGTIVALYHEWNEAERPLQEVRCTRFRLAE